MAANEGGQSMPAAFICGLPDEIISNILLQCSTPTFIQLIQASKELFARVARNDRKLLLHHLNQIPGDKETLQDQSLSNDQLFLSLRQRAANNLYGLHFTANVSEYVNRNAMLNPNACSISGLDADYVRMALTYKHTNDIRQYTSHCQIKEKIKQPPGGKILKLVQWGRVISVLYAFHPDTTYDFSDDSDSSDSESETEVLKKNPFLPSASARLARFLRAERKAMSHLRGRKGWEISDIIYRVTHFDVYTIEDSQTWAIDAYRDYVPRDFIVQSLQQCAILWDRDTANNRPTEDATVINYRAPADPSGFEVPKYGEVVLWPKPKDSSRRDSDSDTDDSPEYLPEGIAFFKDGRRIKMYDAGGVVPYEVITTSTSRQDTYSYSSTNVITFDGFSFHVDTPFYGTHNTFYDDAKQERYCFLTHLCLGVTTLDLDKGDEEEEVRVLCILRAQTRYYPEDCNHGVSLSRMTHVGAGNATVVARLWGWEELHTNLSGKETVSVSPGGTRIAIAMWNKVYVYALNPRILCDEVPMESDEDESIKLKKKKKHSRPWESRPSRYYERKKDINLANWNIAELRPIILDLNGAVAHKMSWSPVKGKITDTITPIVEVAAAPTTEEFEMENALAPEAETGSTSEASTESTIVTAPPATLSTPPELAVVQPIQTEAQITPQPSSELSQADAQPSTSEVVASQDTQIASIATLEQPEPAENESASPADLQTVQDHAQSDISSPTLYTSSCSHSNSSQDQPQIESPPLNSLSTNFPPQFPPVDNILQHPTQTNSAIVTSTQAGLKPLPRNEKSPENSKIENGLPKAYSSYTLTPLKPSPYQAVSAPSLKGIPKAKPTVSEVLENGLSVPLQSPQPIPIEPEKQPELFLNTEGDQQGSTADNMKAAVSPGTDLPIDHSPQSLDKKNGEVPSGSESHLSKAPDDTATPMDPEPSTDIASSDDLEMSENKAEEGKEKASPHKRITEDELIILTDRGIQIWNLGATAKGVRQKKVLPLEEGLQGRLPVRKGKSREILADETEE